METTFYEPLLDQLNDRDKALKTKMLISPLRTNDLMGYQIEKIGRAHV